MTYVPSVPFNAVLFRALLAEAGITYEELARVRRMHVTRIYAWLHMQKIPPGVFDYIVERLQLTPEQVTRLSIPHSGSSGMQESVVQCRTCGTVWKGYAPKTCIETDCQSSLLQPLRYDEEYAE